MAAILDFLSTMVFKIISFHFELTALPKTPDLWHEKQLSSAIMSKDMPIYTVSVAIFDFML